MPTTIYLLKGSTVQYVIHSIIEMNDGQYYLGTTSDKIVFRCWDIEIINGGYYSSSFRRL